MSTAFYLDFKMPQSIKTLGHFFILDFGFDFLKSTVFWILTSIGVRIGLLGFLISQAEETAGSIPAQATVAVSAAASIAVYSLITWYFLDKRLNLE